MHLSILRTVDISMCSLEMELSQVVKLSTVARNRTQVNFRILNILLMILSRQKKYTQVKGSGTLPYYQGLCCDTVGWTTPSPGFCGMPLMCTGLLILRECGEPRPEHQCSLYTCNGGIFHVSHNRPSRSPRD